MVKVIVTAREIAKACLDTQSIYIVLAGDEDGRTRSPWLDGDRINPL